MKFISTFDEELPVNFLLGIPRLFLYVLQNFLKKLLKSLKIKLLSEKFQLLWHFRRSGGFFPVEEFNVAELLVGDAENGDLPVLRKALLYAVYMHICVFRTWAMPHIN